MKAHQRIIRERKAAEENSDLFGKYWENINTDISNAVVREVEMATAKKIIMEYEWLGCMPAVVWHTYGIFFDNCCAGVVCYGPEYSENLGKIGRERGIACADWSKYGFEGKMILLNRGACVHWAHPHTGSKLIRQSMKLLPAKYEVVTSTVDDAAGEIGTIYQACGFYYVGSMRDSNANVNSRNKDRDAWLVDGKLLGSRAIRALCGSSSNEAVAKKFPTAEKIRQNSKHRYFAFRGSKKAIKAHTASIGHLIKTYPKRAGEGSGESRPDSIREGQGQFLTPAPL